jgi:hypothetical protein
MKVQIRPRGPSSVKLKFTLGIPGRTPEFRVDPVTFVLETRYVGDATWVAVPGGDLDDWGMAYRADAAASAAAALASENAAEADRVQTGLDAIATAADRVQTGLDAETSTTKAGESATSATLSQDWATKLTTEVMSGQGYSAREHAIGTAVPTGSAKEWATQTASEVAVGQGYSAKEHAVGTSVSTGSAKDWATKTSAEVVAGQGYGAKKYAIDAAASAAAAATFDPALYPTKANNLSDLSSAETARSNLGIAAYEHGGIEAYYISATSLGVRPKNGDRLIINGVSRPVVATTMANTLFTISTVQFVYAAWSGSAITYEVSSTVPTLHTNGVMIKTADATRTLVACVYRDGSGNLRDEIAYRGILSWFNRRNKPIYLAVAAASASAGNLAASGAIASFLCWRDEGVNLDQDGYVSVNSNDFVFSGIFLDGVAQTVQHGHSILVGGFGSIGGKATLSPPTSESLHTAQCGMRTSGASTATAFGAIDGMIRG